MSTKVLVVESNEYDLNSVVNKLQCNGFNVLKFKDPFMALEFLSTSQSVSVVLISANLPLMSGYNLTRRLKRIYLNADLKIIMMINSCSVSDVRLSIKAGACDLLAKPIDSSVLKYKIIKATNVEQKTSIIGNINKNEITIINFSETNIKFMMGKKNALGEALHVSGEIFRDISIEDFVIKIISKYKQHGTYIYVGVFIGLSNKAKDMLRNYLVNSYKKIITVERH